MIRFWRTNKKYLLGFDSDLVEVQRRFGGTYCLHFQGLKVSQSNSKNRTVRAAYILSVVAWLILCLPKRLLSTELHGVTSKDKYSSHSPLMEPEIQHYIRITLRWWEVTKAYE
jgi:hypothetical protein